MVRYIFLWLIFLPVSLCVRAQSIGAYSGIFYNPKSSGSLYEEFSLAPVYGIRGEFRIKKIFALGLDASYFGKTFQGFEHRDQFYNIGFDTFDVSRNTGYTIDYEAAGFLLEAYFANPEDDTLGIAVGLRGGPFYFSQKAEYDDPDFKDLDNTHLTAGLGIGGRIYRNYLFKTPLQLFIMLDCISIITPLYNPGNLIGGYPHSFALMSGQIKLGFAYKLK
jgi:hypothetical protein